MGPQMQISFFICRFVTLYRVLKDIIDPCNLSFLNYSVSPVHCISRSFIEVRQFRKSFCCNFLRIEESVKLTFFVEIFFSTIVEDNRLTGCWIYVRLLSKQDARMVTWKILIEFAFLKGFLQWSLDFVTLSNFRLLNTKTTGIRNFTLVFS